MSVIFQLLSSGLVLATIFVGAWDCNTSHLDGSCDSLLVYHLGMGKDSFIKFGVNSLSACELASVDRSKCWNLGVAVSYISLSICGLVSAVYGVIVTIYKIKGKKHDIFNFLLAVRITHWIYIAGIGTWVVLTGAFLHPLSLGWCPYVLLGNALIIGYIIGVHLRYWNNRLDMARIMNDLLAQ